MNPRAHSTWTLIRINLLLVALGAVVGALVSIPLTELGKLIAQAPQPADTANYLRNAWSFGIMGAALAPLLGWSWLRRVPLWRAALEPAALGLLGALAGMASGIAALFILGAIAGVTFSSWRLNRVYAHRGRIGAAAPQGQIGMWLLVTVLASVACDGTAPGAPGPRDALSTWSIDTVPSLRLGATMDDTTQLFAVVIGTTRLPDGRILVADRNDQAFQLYAPDGTHLRGFGRQGDGPGEFQYPARFWRCGDSVLVFDINGYKTSVFGMDGTFSRAFRFGAGAEGFGAQTAYRSACNASGQFAHYGWAESDYRAGDSPVFRAKVPFWTSRADTMVGTPLDSFPGSERVITYKRDGTPAGDGPRMFGKQTAIAMGSDQLYIGTAERPEIFVVKLDDMTVDTIRLDWTPALLTQEAIAAEKAIRLATSPHDRHAGIERDFAEHPFPDSLPPYSDLLVDSEDMLWVRGVAASPGSPVTWTIVSAGGVPTARLELPDFLTVFEVGHDYVLGRYVDPVEAIPEVRMYRLSRR